MAAPRTLRGPILGPAVAGAIPIGTVYHFAVTTIAVKTSARTITRDLPDGTYVELVASLCETRMPATIMSLMFVAVGVFAVRASHDGILAVFAVIGTLSSVARLIVLIRGRRLCDQPDMSLAAAQRFERRFALTYCTFACIFGLFAARVFALSLVEWEMPVSIAVVGYAAGAASTIALRPRIVVTSLMLAVLPPSSVLLFRDDTSALISAAALLALLAGGLRSISKRYHSQSTKTTIRQKFALQARTDHLTGLGNRLALVQAFDAYTASHDDTRIAFHYVDIDDFKPINDQLGHQVGDRLLCLIAKRLQQCQQPGDVVVRLGGDEFVIVQANVDDDLDVERYTTRVAHALNSSYTIDGLTVSVGASVGARRHTGPGQSMEALLTAADLALRQQKRERKSRDNRRVTANGATGANTPVRHIAGSVGDVPCEDDVRAQLLLMGTARITWESAADGIVETDSPTWRAYTGQSYDDWKGYGWLTAIHPDDRLKTLGKWREAVRDKVSVHADYRLRGQDGVYRWMAMHAVPLRHEDGSVVKWLGMNIDIDDGWQARQSR